MKYYKVRSLSYLTKKFGELKINKNGYYSFENSIYCIDPKILEHTLSEVELKDHHFGKKDFIIAKQKDSYGNDVYPLDYLEETEEGIE